MKISRDGQEVAGGVAVQLQALFDTGAQAAGNKGPPRPPAASRAGMGRGGGAAFAGGGGGGVGRGGRGRGPPPGPNQFQVPLPNR